MNLYMLRHLYIDNAPCSHPNLEPDPRPQRKRLRSSQIRMGTDYISRYSGAQLHSRRHHRSLLAFTSYQLPFQLVYQNRVLGTAHITFMLWPVVLCNQANQNLSIITACVPYLKPLIDSLESGMIRTDDLRRRDITGAYAYGQSKSRSGSGFDKLSNISSRFTKRAGGDASKSKKLSSVDGVTAVGENAITVTAATGGNNTLNDWDVESQKNSSRIIKQTTSWRAER